MFCFVLIWFHFIFCCLFVFYFFKYFFNEMIFMFYLTECPVGYYVISDPYNCSEPCEFPRYGARCGGRCDCSKEDCHHVHGCPVTSTSYARYTKIREVQMNISPFVNVNLDTSICKFQLFFYCKLFMLYPFYWSPTLFCKFTQRLENRRFFRYR